MGSYLRHGHLLRRLRAVSSPASSFRLLSTSSSFPSSPRLHDTSSSKLPLRAPGALPSPSPFSSHSSQESDAPASVDYRSLLDEGEFHRLADETIHQLQEKFEEYGDEVQIEGFDIDYGNQVLTLKLGSIGTYVINKQTPNRQIWLSSPVSGPSRFDWDRSKKCWLYRRTKAELLRLLEEEFSQLCGTPISLS